MSYIENSIFRYNTVENYGGAVYSNSDININNCNFEEKYAKIYGGAIVGSNININTNQTNTETFSTFFTGNMLRDGGASTKGGGAIYARQTLNIVNAYFAKNQVEGRGGAAYSESNTNINHCLFESNKATGVQFLRGGAIYCKECVGVKNSTFKITMLMIMVEQFWPKS
nr:hypothetical protein [uncultured Methanobrevibacter sp.]